MKIFIGADHRGFNLKESLTYALREQGVEVTDCGAETLNPTDDYVDYALLVGKEVAKNEEARGVLLCGSGAGMGIAANKVSGVRCVVGHTKQEVAAARHDDNCNVLALPADFLSEDEAKILVQTFLQTSFGTDEKYQRRLNKIAAFESNA